MAKIKKIGKLGVSPWPWSINGQASVLDSRFVIISGQYGPYNWDNARLIAAAPELYDVCYRVMRWEDHCKAHNEAIEPWFDIINDMRAALLKAAGKEDD